MRSFSSFFSLTPLPLLLISFFLLTTQRHAFVQALNVSVSTSVPLRVVFFDFDQTLVVGSIGDDVLKKCDPLCLSYNVSVCKCSTNNQAMAKFLQNMPGSKDYVNGPQGLGGPERVQHLFKTFTFLQQHHVELRLLSTSWGIISPFQWAIFLNTFLSLAAPSLATFFPVENIISLRDPGEGIVADKGVAAASYLASKNYTSIHNGILVDDSPTNIGKAQGNVDWVQVFPRTGMSLEVLHFLEKRAVASQYTYEINNSYALKVVFFDFDKTLVKTSVGQDIVNMCDKQCSNYTSLSCNCDMAKFLENMTANKQYVTGPKGLGGMTRIHTLENTLTQLLQKGVSLRILTTSWGKISVETWTLFLQKFFQIASPTLGQIFPAQNIIALADPGEGIAADKGKAASLFLHSKKWNRHMGILVDDSPTNIAKAEGKVDWLQVTPREGIAKDALDFLLTRAGQGTSPPSPAISSPLKKKIQKGKIISGKRTTRYSILVTRTSAYCGGAAPAPNYAAPRPLANWNLLFYQADATLQKRRGNPQMATSNNNGLIHVNLEPLPAQSVYCVVEESKSKDLVVPPNDEWDKYDQKCLQKQHDSCDFLLTAENTTTTLNFPTYCSWGNPCINYTGPIPP